MSEEDKMRTLTLEDKLYARGIEEGIRRCAAIKDAEIAQWQRIIDEENKDHIEQQAEKDKEIAARDLMIKELREALKYSLPVWAAYLGGDYVKGSQRDIAGQALAKSEHHNSRALEKDDIAINRFELERLLLEAELSGLRASVIESTIWREQEILAKLAELNKE